MTKKWTLLFILPWIAIGCDQQAANEALDEAKSTESATIPAMKISPAEDAMANGTQTTAQPLPTPDAREVLSEAISVANADDKALFVHFSADW